MVYVEVDNRDFLDLAAVLTQSVRSSKCDIIDETESV